MGGLGPSGERMEGSWGCGLLLQGLEIVFRVGLALLQVNQTELMQLDMEGMSQVSQDGWAGEAVSTEGDQHRKPSPMTRREFIECWPSMHVALGSISSPT